MKMNKYYIINKMNKVFFYSILFYQTIMMILLFSPRNSVLPQHANVLFHHCYGSG